MCAVCLLVLFHRPGYLEPLVFTVAGQGLSTRLYYEIVSNWYSALTALGDVIIVARIHIFQRTPCASLCPFCRGNYVLRGADFRSFNYPAILMDMGLYC